MTRAYKHDRESYRPSPEDLAAGQVHRFRDHAALYVRGQSGKGTTVYLTPQEARAIAGALLAIAESIETVSFVDSTVGTLEVKGRA